MKKEYDFSKGKRGAVADKKSAKIKKSMYLDSVVIDWATQAGDKLGVGYQTFINMKLREAMDSTVERRVEALEKKFNKHG